MFWTKQYYPGDSGMNTNTLNKLYTLSEACKLLSISTATGRNWIKSGRLVSVTAPGQKPAFEEAFLFAKDFLRVYCSYALRFNLDITKPSFFTEIKDQFKNENTMLVDTILFPRDLKRR